MNTLPRYLVAKYAPDLSRMEPRNIGVIVWDNGRVAARFLDCEDADFVRNQELYRRWRGFWKTEISKDTIQVGGRKKVDRADPGFVDELCRTQKGHFLLFDAGRIHDATPDEDLHDVASFLFDELVSLSRLPAPRRPGPTFREKCRTVIDLSGLTRRNDWKGPQEVQFPVRNTEQHFQFHYVKGNGKPNTIGHRVRITNRENVNSAAFLFEWLLASKTIQDERHLFALVDMSDGANAEDRRDLVANFAETIDVSNETEAAKQLAALAD